MSNEGKTEGKPGLNGAHLNGASDVDADEAPLVDEEVGPAPEASPTPEPVAELAASCARFVLARYGVPLDGTSDTLAILDQYVRDARADLLVQPAGLPLLQATIGAYFGEVVRRAFDASWYAPASVGHEREHEGWRLDFHDVFLTFNPLGTAREALTLGDSEGWHAHLAMDPAEQEEILARLARLPEVPDDEFYAPSTRYDVLEIVVEALRAKAQADGTTQVRFTAEDYRRS